MCPHSKGIKLRKLYLNVQGDMPDITPDMIEKVAKGLSKFDVTTLYTYMHLEEQRTVSFQNDKSRR